MLVYYWVICNGVVRIVSMILPSIDWTFVKHSPTRLTLMSTPLLCGFFKALEVLLFLPLHHHPQSLQLKPAYYSLTLMQLLGQQLQRLAVRLMHQVSHRVSSCVFSNMFYVLDELITPYLGSEYKQYQLFISLFILYWKNSGWCWGWRVPKRSLYPFFYSTMSVKSNYCNIILACAQLHESGTSQGKHCSINQVYRQVVLLLLLKLFLSLHGTWRYTRQRLRSRYLPDYKLKLFITATILFVSLPFYVFHAGSLLQT